MLTTVTVSDIIVLAVLLVLLCCTCYSPKFEQITWLINWLIDWLISAVYNCITRIEENNIDKQACMPEVEKYWHKFPSPLWRVFDLFLPRAFFRC